MQAQKPLPQPTPDTRPFWDAMKRHELRLPKCNSCGELHYYPRSFCSKCFSRDLEWVTCSGRGKVYSYVISYRPAPDYRSEAPYVIAVVELEEGVRMLSNLVGVEPDPARLSLDMPVEVTFEEASDDVTLPLFRPVGEGM